MYIHEVISAPDSRASFCLLILLFVKLALEDDLPADHGQFWGSTLNLGELYVFHYMYIYIYTYVYLQMYMYTRLNWISQHFEDIRPSELGAQLMEIYQVPPLMSRWSSALGLASQEKPACGMDLLNRQGDFNQEKVWRFDHHNIGIREKSNERKALA